MASSSPVFWIELDLGYSAAVGTARGGVRGFFVLGRRTSRSDDHPRPMIASGQYARGRATITRGMLSQSTLREIERRLREWPDN